MIDFSAPGVGVLSQNFLEHLEDLAPAHPTTFDQADHRPHVGQHPGVPPWRTALGAWKAGGARRRGLTGRWLTIALLVEVALLPPALGRTVIGDTPNRGLPLAMSSLAAKRTPQVLPPAITPINEEKDAAMPAPNQASPQARFGPQQRSQNRVILQDQLANALCPIPLWSKLKMPRDLSCKKPRLSLWILSCLKTPSSCLKDIPMSRQDEDSPLSQLKRPTARLLRLLGKEKPAPAAPVH